MTIKKANIILDCTQMKYPQSGLYNYCLSLGSHVYRLLENDPLAAFSVYIPENAKSSFGPTVKKHVRARGIKKFISPGISRCAVWHLPFQSGKWSLSKWKHPFTKRVLTIHDLNIIHEGGSPEEIRKSLVQTQKLIDTADTIICISEFCKNDVLRNCKVDNKTIHVIHNGSDNYSIGELASPNYRPANPFLFSLGYVNAKKNYHVLLPLLENNDYELVIAGLFHEPLYVEFIKQSAKEKGVADRVILLGPVPEKDKNWYLANCTAFMHPSLAEGFGFPVVEAMHFGKPLFLSDKTALPEIGGDIAFYFKDFSAVSMEEVFRKGIRKYEEEQMAEKIKKRAALFDWNRQAMKYVEVYRSLL